MTHLDVTSRNAIAPEQAKGMDTGALRAAFLIEDLFRPRAIRLTYTHYDRMIVGGAIPVGDALILGPVKLTGTPGFLDRREMIVVNIGGRGSVTADGQSHDLGTRDMLYVGMGGGDVSFASTDPSTPAKFYIVSAPAHHSYPTRLIRIDQAKRVDLGSGDTCNERSIFQFIHPEGAQTCQLVVGMTTLAKGSIWNTMPAHTHSCRMEAYLYFDLDPAQRVIHLMGEPEETRHLIVANEQAILSPPWSVHSGAGTASYTFIWAMAGDNVDYTDVEVFQPAALR
ncbi:MAG: 5-dehydro-4-deoxy-D-glucuronate isomerase [Acetobacteraceae bacterium]|nr:MAG: 5-dehydro-4-deoxy-D-glucuronate isomerase [Acetobacteraceae bacterium]